MAHRCHYHYRFLLLSLFIAFTRVSPPPGCHPHLFYPSDLVSPLFFVNLPTNFFSFGCHPLEGVTRGRPPPPSDATETSDTHGGAGRVSVDIVVEQRVVSTDGTVGLRGTGAVAAGRVTAQTSAVVGVEVRLRTGRNAAAVFDVVDAVAIALVRTRLAASPTLRVTPSTRLFRIRIVM